MKKLIILVTTIGITLNANDMKNILTLETNGEISYIKEHCLEGDNQLVVIDKEQSIVKISHFKNNKKTEEIVSLENYKGRTK